MERAKGGGGGERRVCVCSPDCRWGFGHSFVCAFFYQDLEMLICQKKPYPSRIPTVA